MRVAWHLSELFYWSAPPSTASSTVEALQLVTWARASLDPFSVDESHHPSSNEYFWSYIRRLLIRGETMEAVTLLASNSSNPDSHTVYGVLRKKPNLPNTRKFCICFLLCILNNCLFMFIAGQAADQFLSQHAQWAAECKALQTYVSPLVSRF